MPLGEEDTALTSEFSAWTSTPRRNCVLRRHRPEYTEVGRGKKKEKKEKKTIKKQLLVLVGVK